MAKILDGPNQERVNFMTVIRLPVLNQAQFDNVDRNAIFIVFLQKAKLKSKDVDKADSKKPRIAMPQRNVNL